MGAEAQPEPTLLADVRWLRLLAAQLAGAADGDDLAQDTMMVALRRAPPEGEQRRPWLVVTARNLWRRRRRDQGRRLQHDAALETPEPPPTAEAALERLDTLRLVADLVRALPDPYRATVLMRYFEGKSAAEIAAATGVPAGTVRWRLKEALDRLRVALDARHGGERRRWTLLLLPPGARPRGPALAGVGVGAMVAVTAAVTLVAVGVRGRSEPRLESARPAVALASHQPLARTRSQPAPAARGGLLVTGLVREPSGRPAAGAEVVLFATRETTLATDPTLLDLLGGRTVTGVDGRFVLPSPLPGDFVLTAAHDRFGPAEQAVSLAAGGAPRDAVLTLTPTGQLLSGRIRDAGAGPVIGARITAVEFPSRGPAVRFGTTSGADGRYALRLPRGSWHVSASADGYAYAWLQVDLPAPAARDLVLQAAGSIAGVVVDTTSGAPVPNAVVRVDEAGKPQGRFTTAGPDGHFSFGASWPAAGHRLTAWADNRAGRLEVPAPADPAVRPPVRVAIAPGATVSGRVTDERGQPLAGAVVQIFESAMQLQPLRQFRTDARGGYALAGLLPGPLFLAAEAPGRAPQRRRMVVSGATTADFALDREGTLTGTVSRADGTPARAAELRVTLLEGATLLAFRRVQTTQGGAFRIAGLAAGRYIVDVQSREGAGRFGGALAAGEQRQLGLRLSAVDEP